MTRNPTQPALAALLLLIGACSGARNVPPITAYTDPDFLGHTYERIVVIAALSDLEVRSQIETAIVNEFRERGVIAEAGARLFTPTRVWTSEQQQTELRRRGTDGMLRVELVSSWSTDHHVPQTTTTDITRDKSEETEVKGEGSSKEKEKEKETITTTTTGGYVTRSDWSRYQIQLVDVASSRVAWVGVMALASSGHGVVDFGSKVIEQLQYDRLVAGSD